MATGKAAAQVAPDPALVQAHARLIADTGTQFQFSAFAPPELPAWLKPLAQLFRTLAPYSAYLFWGGVVIAGGVVVWLVLREARGMALRWPWRTKPHAVDDADWRPDADAARALLADAEMLAAEGRFAEAARLLLRRSVDDIARRRPDFVKPSLTARDIAAASAIPEGARHAFAAIARVVEVSAFGSAPVSADAWTDCRRAYGEFALAGAWRG